MKLQTAKDIIKENFTEAPCGLFSTRNIAGDRMETLYHDSNVQIDICRNYEYFEVFGLSDEEFEELHIYYDSLREEE